MIQTRILYAGEDIVDSADVQDKLQTLHYEVLATVQSGKEAIQRAKALKPDLVLINPSSQEQNGWPETARRIRQRLGIPVVFLSEPTEDSSTHQRKGMEAFPCILKPFKERELYLGIETALYKHKMGKLRKCFRERTGTQDSRLPNSRPLPEDSISLKGSLQT